MAETVTYPSIRYVHTDTDDIFTQDRKNRYGGEIQAIETELGSNPKTSVLSGTYADVAARLAALDTLLTAGVNQGVENLLVTVNAATPLTKVDVTADYVAVQGFAAATVSQTADITVNGLNGLDTGARATITWYSIWVGYSPTARAKGSLLSTSSTRAGLTLTHATLVGFTQWRRVGWVRTDATGSGNFIPFLQTGHQVVYMALLDVTSILASGQATTVTAITTAMVQKFVPPNVRHALLDVAMKITGNTTVSANSRGEVQFCMGGASASQVRACGSWVITGTFQAQASTQQVWVPVGASRELSYMVKVATSGAGSDYAVDVSVAGYTDNGF